MFYLIDKPLGISSFDVIRALRKSLATKKMGHSGTLDPLATGCLLVATENSTKLLPLLENAKKEYIFTVRIDGKSDSLDAGTPITPIDTRSRIDRSPDEIRDFLQGIKSQTPPTYSALHIWGERAYDLARKWADFTLPERPIEVSEVEIIEFTGMTITLRMVLSSGGYIRSFAPVIGKFLWVEWGYVSSLRRTNIFTAYGAMDVRDASLLGDPRPIEYSQLFSSIPHREIESEAYRDLVLGRPIRFEHGIQDGLIFLTYPDLSYTSLCDVEKGIATIIRNNV